MYTTEDKSYNRMMETLGTRQEFASNVFSALSNQKTRWIYLSLQKEES